MDNDKFELIVGCAFIAFVILMMVHTFALGRADEPENVNRSIAQTVSVGGIH